MGCSVHPSARADRSADANLSGTLCRCGFFIPDSICAISVISLDVTQIKSQIVINVHFIP
jgi:hypothetical protein